MFGIGLVQPKFDSNVGSAMRATSCYNGDFVVTVGKRYKKQSTDTPKTFRHIPCFNCISTSDLKNYIPQGCIPIAVDLTDDAECVFDFKHPKSAMYLFGPEDGTLQRSVTGLCKTTIYIPTKYCMNLAATVNVILYDRMIKEQNGR